MLDVACAAKPSTLVTVKVAVVAPDATVTVAGTVAAPVFPLASVNTTPLAGAEAFNVTVAVDVEAVPLAWLVRVLGFKVRLEICGGFTVRTAVCCTPLYVAVMVEVAWAPTLIEVTVNVAVVAFAATVTVAGTVAAAVLLLVNVTTAPPVGACPFRVTVAVELAEPPCTEVGANPSEVTPDAGAFTVRVAL
jgi:hypothetical protein